MQTANRQMLFTAINSCVKEGRAHQHTNPDRTVQELEKLALLSDILESVINFEMKLLENLDVD